METRFFSFLLVLMALFACEGGIRNGNELSKKQRAYITELGLLEENEQILMFSSSLDIKTSGNFFTDKRIAAYWIDDDKTKTSINTAYYEDIDSIKIKDLSHALTYASYLQVFADSIRFKVYVDGDSTEVYQFFNEAIDLWNSKGD